MSIFKESLLKKHYLLNIFDLRFGLSFLLILIISISSSFKTNAQCGAGVENIAITNYCNNQYASWTITNPGVGSSYRWMTTIPSDLTNPSATAGNVILGISSTASSITRLATPTGTATGQIQYYYVKETATSAVPSPTPLNSLGVAGSPSGNPFSMTFTTTSTIRMNSVDVPVVINYGPNNYKIQIRIQGPAGYDNYSPVYNYTGSSGPKISGSYYLETIPVNLSLTTTGIYTISVIQNPASGTGNNPDGLVYTNGAYAGGSYPGLNVQGGVLNPIYSGTNSSIIYNWNYTSYCGPNPSGNAFPTSTGCCSPVYINPTIGSSTNIIQTGVDAFTITSVNLSECTGSGCYYQWYKDGVSISGANGLNKTSYIATSSGVYTSRIVLNSAYINNQSCYSQSSWNMDERAIFASATTPGAGPYCIGDKFYFNSTVTGSNIQWSPSAGLSSTNTKSTIYTANSLGSVQVVVSANITSGDKIINGDFETGIIGPAGATQLSPQADPGGVDGSYTIKNSVPAQDNGSGNNSFWKSCSGDGKFLIVNGFPNNSNTQIYSQNVVGITPGQTYTLSFDITNISRNAAYNGSPTGADTDVQLQVSINNATASGIITAGANGILANVCSWTTNTVNWTAPANVTSANIVFNQVNLFNGAGLDFAVDNIRFGGLTTQDAKITIGPINDCSTITAFSTGCSGTSATITASVTGGLVFDHWEKPLGTIVGTNISLSLSSSTGGVYTAFGVLPLGNVLVNGDFESGNTGFISGNPNYYSYQSSFASGGANAYTISNNSSAGNSYWFNLTPPVTTSSQMFIADAKQWNSGGVTGNKVIGWNFTANAGDKFKFSGYVANQHTLVTQPITGTLPAQIGIAINNSTITSLSLPADNNWHYMTSLWTAPTTGSYTLDVLNLFNYSGAGNDFVLDQFALQPLFGAFKTATTTSPLCVLAIELLSFDISKKSDGVHLDWSTSQLNNSQGYYIERSSDGISFTTIGFTNTPNKSSNLGISYSFIDKSPISGTYYYRLRQLDLNGKVDYSDIKSINLSDYSVQVYPNPTNGSVTIALSIGIVNASVHIYNNLGALIGEYSLKGGVQNSLELDLQMLSSGLYTILVSSNGDNQIVKLIKE